MAVSLLTVLLLGGISFTSQSLTVYINGSEGKDSPECLNSSSSETPCQSLSFVSENLTQKQFVHIEILGDILNLTRAVNFTDYSHLNISGSGGYTTVRCNESIAGLAFLGVKNLLINSLTVENCGALQPSTSYNQDLSVAVYILSCTNLLINATNIVYSNGTGLSIYDTNGVVDIMHCNFTNNRVVGLNSSGGGGVHIEFTLCTPGVCERHSNTKNNSRYTIHNCKFINNFAYSLQRRYIQTSPQVFIPRLGKGGGLYLSIGWDATNNTFLIAHCTFKSNEASINGGGMLAEFLNSVANNNISVLQTDFIENTCTQNHHSAGGGLLVDFMFYTKSRIHGQLPIGNSFMCNLCAFQGNKGGMGGGTTITSAKNENASFANAILFSNCSWIENESAMGAAVYITPAVWDYTKMGFPTVPVFRDCTFQSNSANEELEPPMAEGVGVKVQSVGYGALFISQLSVNFSGISHFCNNRGSAIHLSSSVIDFEEESSVMFCNNTSHNGGAIAMYGPSMIQIRNSSSFLFINNTAISKGGAIHSDLNGASYAAYHNCFISSPDLLPVNSTFVFKNNSARDSGDSIFTTTFLTCEPLCNNTDMYKSPADIMQCLASFSFDETSSPLSTRPKKFNLQERKPLKLNPGVEHYINLTAEDETNNTLSTIVYAATVSSPNITVCPAFRQVSNNTVKVKGPMGSTAELLLYTADVFVSFNITLSECQPGYHYSPSSSKCECASSEYLGLDGCDPSVNLRDGFWMGFCSRNGSELCTAYCPYGFCPYSGINPGQQFHVLSKDIYSLNYKICGPSRTNRLCGECSPGHSMYYNSMKRTCGSEKLCHLGWLFYILSDTLPLTIFFILILVFNISFTKGNANCFIMYGQLLGSLSYDRNNSMQFSLVAKWIQNIVTFPYNSFNLNFFTWERLSFCLWKGATFMGTMMMNYVTVGSALVLVFITIVVTRYQYVRTKIFFRFEHRSSVLIHGLSAFFILCYSQAARTTFHILNFSCLYSANFHCRVKVVHLAGHLTYLEKEHVPYALVAFMFLIFMIIIPPLLLLTYPLMFKLFGLCNLSETKLVTILWRMMPIQFLDAFQSSFKDKYRFFAGLYFLYRAAILALYVWCQSWLDFHLAVQLLLMVIMTVHFVFQPHKERKHNIIDSLLFANLSLINVITLYYYSRTEVLGRFRSETMISVLAMFQALLIILPLLIIITLYIIKILRRKPKDYESLPSLRIDREDSMEKF